MLRRRRLKGRAEGWDMLVSYSLSKRLRVTDEIVEEDEGPITLGVLMSWLRGKAKRRTLELTLLPLPSHHYFTLQFYSASG